MSVKKKVLIWIPTAILGFVFLVVGAGKLSGQESAIAQFAHWGYPAWFMFVIGGVEALGAVALLVPRTARYGALVLLAVMIGAAGTHIRAGEWTNVIANTVIGFGLWWIWKARSATSDPVAH
jgi:uncharacterized membrane protein YphA (DoxX/SURF4 family)